LGIRDAFDPDRADFSGIAEEGLFVKLAIQQADLAVDEKGTVGAAVTVIGLAPPSVPRVDVELTFDRPFLALIRDRRTGTPLFLARVADPR
jgi:serpin B